MISYVLKVSSWTFDIVTLPVYFLIQRPWRTWAEMRTQWSAPEVAGDPSSPWSHNRRPAPDELAECTNFTEIMKRAISRGGDHKAFGHREVLSVEKVTTPEGKTLIRRLLDDKYTWVTYAEANKRIDAIARGLRAEGVNPGDKVILLMETRPEWQLCAQAVIRMGATLGTLYATLGKDGITHGINELEAKVLITSADMMTTVADVAPKLPLVKTIVVVASPGTAKNGVSIEGLKVTPLETVEGNGQKDKVDISYQSQPDDIVLILYTSGSSGLPKGVVLTQRVFVAAYTSMYCHFYQFNFNWKDDSYLAYLPLAHVFEFMLEFMAITYCLPIGYGSPMTLATGGLGLVKGCPGDAVVLKPTGMATVPLMLDKIRGAALAQVASQSAFRQALFGHFVEYKAFWNESGWKTPLVDKVIFAKTKAILGGRLKVLIVGAAPLSCETQRFARTVLDVILNQGYGASETLSIGHCGTPMDYSLGRCGPPVLGLKVKLVAWEEAGYSPFDVPNPRGEVYIGGEHVAVGYYKRDEATKEAFLADETNKNFRWFITGDIGEIFPDGTLKIIDRKKDLVKLQNGEYLSLGKVESSLISCPYLDNLCVYASSMSNFAIALLLPNRKAISDLAKDLGLAANNNNLEEICKNKDIERTVLKALTELGKKGDLGRLEIPAKVLLCPEEWTPTSGLVTATMKIRRKQIVDFYKKQINEMYK